MKKQVLALCAATMLSVPASAHAEAKDPDTSLANWIDLGLFGGSASRSDGKGGFTAGGLINLNLAFGSSKLRAGLGQQLHLSNTFGYYRVGGVVAYSASDDLELGGHVAMQLFNTEKGLLIQPMARWKMITGSLGFGPGGVPKSAPGYFGASARFMFNYLWGAAAYYDRASFSSETVQVFRLAGVLSI